MLDRRQNDRAMAAVIALMAAVVGWSGQRLVEQLDAVEGRLHGVELAVAELRGQFTLASPGTPGDASSRRRPARAAPPAAVAAAGAHRHEERGDPLAIPGR
ncbi:MAG TPA: hypothetical protein VEC14_01185 [Reyranellaceae bacterium]|nr:hypothetical protein [Reyranellaceae bacterium]